MRGKKKQQRKVWVSYFVSNAERKAGTGCGGKDITIWTSMTLPERERYRDYSSLTWGRPSNAVYSVLQDLRDVYNYAARIWQLSQNYFPIYYKYCFNEKGSLDNWNFQFGKYKELWLEMSDKTGPTLQNHFQEKITTVREKKNRWYSKFTLIYTFHSGYGGFPVLLTKDISLI